MPRIVCFKFWLIRWVTLGEWLTPVFLRSSGLKMRADNCTYIIGLLCEFGYPWEALRIQPDPLRSFSNFLLFCYYILRIVLSHFMFIFVNVDNTKHMWRVCMCVLCMLIELDHSPVCLWARRNHVVAADSEPRRVVLYPSTLELV